MSSDDEYDVYFSPIPDEFLLEEPQDLEVHDLPRPPSVVPPSREDKGKPTKKQESDEDLLRRMQPLAAHTSTHAYSYRNLSEVQKAAAQDPDREEKYSPSEARATMKFKTQMCCNGKIPRWYQEDTGDAFMLGMDVVLVSGTGSGKTLAFLQGLLADRTEKSQLVIISPLNELEYDMAERCNKMGLPALAVNGDMWAKDPLLHKKLLSHQFRVILTSPEMIFQHPTFSSMMRNSEWTENIIGTVIDEAHCVLEWKDQFRTAFGLFNKARAYLPGKPIFAASATLTPSMIDSLTDTLSFSRKNSFILNVGNDRPNITTVVCRMAGGESDFAALDFLLDEVREDKPLIRTMVFFNTRDTAQRGCQYLKNKLSEDSPYREQLYAMWATKSTIAKRKIMQRFRNGKIVILFATEVAGMGMDLGDIRRVVQYMIPQKLMQWTQHAGRCGRDGRPAIALLLVEPSVFQKVRKRSSGSTAGKMKKKKAKQDASVQVKVEEVEGPNLNGTQHESYSDGDLHTTNIIAGALGEELIDVPADVESDSEDEDIEDNDSDVAERPEETGYEDRDEGLSGDTDSDDDGEDTDDIDQQDDTNNDPDDDSEENAADESQIETDHQIADTVDYDGGNSRTYMLDDHNSLNTDDDSEFEYRKKVEGWMRDLAETQKCRRDITDVYYGNPSGTRALTLICCDNCVRKHGDNTQVSLSSEEVDLLALITRIELRDTSPSTSVFSTKAKRRWKNRRKTVLGDLKSWRDEIWNEYFSQSILLPESIVSDRMLGTLATNTCIDTIEDLRTAVPNWTWLDDFGPLVLARIATTDSIWLAKREEEIEQNKVERKAQTAQRQADKAQQQKENRAANRIIKIEAEQAQRDLPGTFLTYVPEEHHFVHEDGTLQPKINETGPLLSTVTDSDHCYYLESALVLCPSDSNLRELVALDLCSSSPLKDSPRASPAVKIASALRALEASHHLPPDVDSASTNTTAASKVKKSNPRTKRAKAEAMEATLLFDSESAKETSSDTSSNMSLPNTGVLAPRVYNTRSRTKNCTTPVTHPPPPSSSTKQKVSRPKPRPRMPAAQPTAPIAVPTNTAQMLESTTQDIVSLAHSNSTLTESTSLDDANSLTCSKSASSDDASIIASGSSYKRIRFK